jgi:hypothetical protein
MIPAIIVLAFYTILIIGWIRFNKKLSIQKEIIDNTFKNATMTHNWTTKEGIQPDTIIYEFPNKMYAMHDKRLNRLYVYSSSGIPVQEPIDTTTISVIDFEDTLLGIEKR